MAALVWSVWVFSQPEPLDSLYLYHVVTDIASDTTWVLLALFVGVFQLAATCLDNRKARFVAAFLAASFWLCLAYGLWLGNPSAPGAALHVIMGALNMTSMALLSLKSRADAP